MKKHILGICIFLAAALAVFGQDGGFGLTPIARGGTAASTAAQARINLGVGTSSSPTFTGLTVTNFPTFTAGTPTRVPFFSTAGLLADSANLTYNSGTGALTATTFVGAVTGTATNATNIGITDDTTTNATMYPLWVTAATGNLPAKVSSTKLTYNPSTGALSAGSGSITGGAISGSGTITFDSGTGALPSAITGSPIRLGHADDVANAIQADSYGTGTALQLLARHSGGTRASPAATPSGAIMVDALAYGYTDALRTSPNGRYRISAKSLWSATNAETQHIWSATPSGSLTSADIMILDSASGLQVTVGGLNNTVIGATTPAAGSFTTLGASGAATFSQNLQLGSTYALSWGAAYGAGVPSIIGDNGADVIQFYPTGSTGGAIGTFSSTGLAVTGTLTQTGGSGSVWTYGGGGGGLELVNSSDTSGTKFIAFDKSTGANIGSITRVTTTDAVAYNTTSDGRLKTNVRDFTAEDSGRIIDGLRPRWFDWKASDLTETVEETFDTGEKDKDGKPVMSKRQKQQKVTDAKRLADHVANNQSIIGFIAQEEAAVDPALVRIGAVTPGDDDPTIISKQWARSDAALVPVLVAEVKELRKRASAAEAKLADLETRLAALEKK